MDSLLQDFVTPQLVAAIIAIVVLLVLLYVISVIWVIRDAYQRGTNPVLWGIIALVPYIGAFAYSMMRPPMLLADKDEQSLDFALKQRELMRYGECGKCGYPVEREYLMCPRCGTQLKKECPNCGHALNPEWTVCPYCCTPAKK
jgi:RNA polymerase subunit RPABC4/transcription elongation factor Spt4